MKFKMTGFEEYDDALKRLGAAYDPTCKKMLAAATRIVKEKLMAANSEFAKYVKGKTAKRSNFGGWYAKVGFGGYKNGAQFTSGGTYAARAAVIYEYGRTAGTYRANYTQRRNFFGEKFITMKPDVHEYPDQPARPFIRRTIDEAAPEVVEAMQQIYEEEVKKIFG